MTTPDLSAAVTVGATTLVGDNCTLGCPREQRVKTFQTTGQTEPAWPVDIGERCVLMNQVVIYEGVEIGNDCYVEDRVRIGYSTVVGPRSRLVYGAYVCDRVRIGADARVAGFVCDETVIGDRSTVMGELVHEYTQPHQDWWKEDEPPPIIESDTVVGYGARVIGGVKIGPCSYVAAGAIVTKDVPPLHVVVGTNVQVPAVKWRGERLHGLLHHWRSLHDSELDRHDSTVDER